MNVFLTGHVQVGKSTAIRRFLEKHRIPVSGFQTIIDRKTSILTMKIYNRSETSDDHLTVLKVASRNPATGFPLPDLAEFNRAGRLLAQINLSSCPLFIMDELGYMERNAAEFRSSVKKILDSDTPVLGVVRYKPDGPFWQLLHEQKDTIILTVDETNRDQIHLQIEKHLKY